MPLIQSSNSLPERAPVAEEPTSGRFLRFQFVDINTVSSLLRTVAPRLVVLRANQMHSHCVENISPGAKLSILISGDEVKCSPKHVRVGRIDTDGKVSLQITQTIGCLITMAMPVPEENAPGIEIVARRAGKSRPKPIV